MTCMLKRSLGAVCGMALVLALASCRKDPGSSTRIWRMGEQVQVGPLIYSVIEAEWHGHLAAGGKERLPQNRFLIVRVSVTNSGGREVGVPGMVLETPQGESYYEDPDGEGVPDWLPGLRRLAPAETREGRILFDAPQKSYRLRVQEEGMPEQPEEKLASALIDIPLDLRAPVAIPLKR